MEIIKPNMPLPEFASFSAHPLSDGTERTAEMYICTPASGVTKQTGMMLVNHNWGGTWQMCAPWCQILADKLDLITIDVNYYQSGWTPSDGCYDHGVIQSMDCLRALYEVRKYAAANNIPFDPARTFTCGASGGGNVAQMLNKFAPHTFACIVDLCGVVFDEDVAYGMGPLNAGYSKDPASPAFLTRGMLEIRDLANPVHLDYQYRCNPDNKIIIIHGTEDESCPCSSKAKVFAAQLNAGFLPEAHFITTAKTDGIIMLAPDHSLGDRAYIIARYSYDFIAPAGQYSKRLSADDDFARKSRITYPVDGGVYTIDFTGSPRLSTTDGRF